MTLTEFLQRVGRDFSLQARFFYSDADQFLDDPKFAKLLSEYGWDDLDPNYRELIESRDLAGIADVLAKERNPGIGPCWVLVRI